MRFIKRVDRTLTKVEEILLALLLVGMIVLAALQVLLRNIWNTGIDWVDPALQNITVVLGLLGAALATSADRHLNIDIFGRLFHGRSKQGLRVVIGLLSSTVCLFLMQGGWVTYRVNYLPWVEALPAGWSPSRMLMQELSEGTVPQWLSQVILPIGFGLIALHFILRLIVDIEQFIGGGDKPNISGHEGERLP